MAGSARTLMLSRSALTSTWEFSRHALVRVHPPRALRHSNTARAVAALCRCAGSPGGVLRQIGGPRLAQGLRYIQRLFTRPSVSGLKQHPYPLRHPFRIDVASPWEALYELRGMLGSEGRGAHGCRGSTGTAVVGRRTDFHREATLVG